MENQMHGGFKLHDQCLSTQFVKAIRDFHSISIDQLFRMAQQQPSKILKAKYTTSEQYN
jgi:hypothetical protein